MNRGYDEALSLAKSELSRLSPKEVIENTGVFWDGETYKIPWFNNKINLDDGTIEEKIIWYHYLCANGSKVPKGVYINYKQVPGAYIYNDNFIKRAIKPMVKTFAQRLDKFLEVGLALGGKQTNLGHMSFTLQLLPYLPVTYVIWQGDDEIPDDGNILFDETAINWLCAEDLVVLASLPVYKMMKM